MRKDIPAPARRSVADPQNYGDEVDAKELIHPRMVGETSIERRELDALVHKSKVRALFQTIGYQLDDIAFDKVFQRAAASGAEDEEYTTINAFRDALNLFLDENA